MRSDDSYEEAEVSHSDRMQSKQYIEVMVDEELMRRVDALTGDRTQAIEEALHVWCEHQEQTLSAVRPATQQRQPIEKPQPMTPAEYLQHRHNTDETGWLV